MSRICRILLPIYERRDTYPSLDHALSLAKRSQSRVLFAAIAGKSRFIRTVAAAGAAAGVVDEDQWTASCTQIERETSRLARRAQELGLCAECVTIGEPCEERLVALTRQMDLVVECTPHRANVTQRLLGDTDLYQGACCPVLVSGGQDFALSPTLLIYNTTARANRALRWLTALAEDGHIPDMHILALYRRRVDRGKVHDELASFASSHSLAIETEMVEVDRGFRRAVEKAHELRAGVVALPSFGFKKPLRLRLQGIDAKALHELGCSGLVFPKASG